MMLSEPTSGARMPGVITLLHESVLVPERRLLEAWLRSIAGTIPLLPARPVPASA